MLLNRGISVDALATLDGDCPISCQVHEDHVELEFGHPGGTLNLALTEPALARLGPILAEALVTMRSSADGGE